MEDLSRELRVLEEYGHKKEVQTGQYYNDKYKAQGYNTSDAGKMALAQMNFYDALNHVIAHRGSIETAIRFYREGKELLEKNGE